MNAEIVGARCLVSVDGVSHIGKIIKLYQEIGYEDHGEWFFVVVLEGDGFNLWNSEKRLHISQLNIIN